MQFEEDTLAGTSTGGCHSNTEQMDHETLSVNDGSSRSNHEPPTTSNSNNNANNHQQQQQSQSTSNHNTGCQGYYDAEKCRAHIANQTRVSKIDRVAAQIARALEVETGFQSRLISVLNMFLKRSALVAMTFTTRCKFGLKRHRQDRILNQSKRRRRASASTTLKVHSQTTRRQENKKNSGIDYSDEQFTISNDLLYGQGVQLIHELLSQSMAVDPPGRPSKTIKRPTTTSEDNNYDCKLDATKLDSWDDTQFEPDLYVKKLEDYLQISLRKSNLIAAQLNKIKSTFERLATEHRDQVDLVYAAEENRQATTVIRRSAYNLSVAAIKATSTPVHVNANILA